MVFGQIAPRPLQWWARWVHAAFLALVTAFIGYGFSIDALPDRRGTSAWFFIGLFSLLTLAVIARAIYDTVRHFRERSTTSTD